MIVDLTHPLRNSITYYPGTLEPHFDNYYSIQKDGFAEMKISMLTHNGTHIDAPCHILPNTKSLDQFPLDKFIGKGIIIDCTKTSAITLDLIKSKEEKIKGADFILFYSGWQEKWNAPNYFDEFPVLTKEATEWLISFNLKALGFDTISADKTIDSHLPIHHLLLSREILIIENLTNLDKLIGFDFDFSCIPLNIEKSDGSPVRAFAHY